MSVSSTKGLSQPYKPEEIDQEKMAQRILSPDFSYAAMRELGDKVFWENGDRKKLGEQFAKSHPGAYRKLLDAINMVDTEFPSKWRTLFSGKLRFAILKASWRATQKESATISEGMSTDLDKTIAPFVHMLFMLIKNPKFAGLELEKELNDCLSAKGRPYPHQIDSALKELFQSDPLARCPLDEAASRKKNDEKAATSG